MPAGDVAVDVTTEPSMAPRQPTFALPTAARPEVLPLYFTYPSPFAYLAWHRITTHPERYRRVRMRWTPILFRRLMDLSGGPSGGSPPLQLEYNYADAERWARLYGVPFAAPHRADPTNQAAHKIHLLAQDAGDAWEARWMAAMHRFVRVDGHDPTDERALLDLGRGLGVPGVESIRDPRLDERLEANTQQALRDRVCGVPFVRWNGEAYWGNDRLVWLEAHLAGKAGPEGV